MTAGVSAGDVPGKDDGINSPVTIHEVAKAAGVHPSTVSRALAKSSRVSDGTRRHVKNVAAQLGYRANPLGPVLLSDRTSILGLIVDDLSDPSCLDIIGGVESRAGTDGYALMLTRGFEISDRETAAARAAALDGILLIGPAGDEGSIRELSHQKPIVVINHEIEGITGVVPDIKKGIGEAIRHVRAGGHRKIVFIAGPQEAWRMWEEIQAACQWPRLETVRITSTEPTVEGGRKTARQVLASGATAVLTYNDLLAVGLLGELQAAFITAPDHISIIGFGDIIGAAFTTPSLTTVRAHGRQSGMTATTLLLLMIQGNPPASPTSLVETELVIRTSTGRLPRQCWEAPDRFTV